MDRISIEECNIHSWQIKVAVHFFKIDINIIDTVFKIILEQNTQGDIN